MVKVRFKLSFKMQITPKSTVAVAPFEFCISPLTFLAHALMTMGVSFLPLTSPTTLRAVVVGASRKCRHGIVKFR